MTVLRCSGTRGIAPELGNIGSLGAIKKKATKNTSEGILKTTTSKNKTCIYTTCICLCSCNEWWNPFMSWSHKILSRSLFNLSKSWHFPTTYNNVIWINIFKFMHLVFNSAYPLHFSESLETEQPASEPPLQLSILSTDREILSLK